eukprot:Phypoly_transcript_15631.p1 GENE.Phypoly_transcript_15631~~Phypoly_transcript_15631.p1  ORF type:complete len:224 (+),score=62.51 Phypoly_transcript_15631:155-826(+)
MTKADPIPYGTVVWGKLQGFQEWPSRYAHPNETSQKVRDMKTDDEEVLIFFFGTHNYAWLKPEKIFPFDENFAELSLNKKRKKNFDAALGEALKWRDNPKKKMPTYEQKGGEKGTKAPKEDAQEDKGKKPRLPKKKEAEKKDTGISEEDYVPVPIPQRLNTPEYLARKKHRQAIMRKLGLAPPTDDFLQDKAAFKKAELAREEKKEKDNQRAKRSQARNSKRE